MSGVFVVFFVSLIIIRIFFHGFTLILFPHAFFVQFNVAIPPIFFSH